MRLLHLPGNLLHALFVVLVVLAYLARYGAGRLWAARIRDRARRSAAVGRLRGRVLRRAMTRLGATFIKTGQVMSTRPDLFAPEIIDELAHLQDRLPAFPFGRARRTIERELGRPIAELYRELDAEPVAAASVAQVHRGRLLDGTEVAVKVLRPSIRRQVQRDGVLLVAGARLIALHPRWRLSDPVAHVRHFVEAIADQTDLRIEARNYDRFHANFAQAPHVRFPRVHETLSSQSVLTMDFMRGTKLADLPPGSHPELARRIRQAIFQMCFHDGFLHADLHPGNLLITDDGALVLFDVGLAKLLHDDVLAQFIDMTKCLTMGTAEDVVAHLRRFHHYLEDVDWDALRADVVALVERFRAKNVRELEYGQLVGDMLALGRKHRVRPVPDMTLVFVAMVTAQGLGKRLSPDAQVFQELASYLVPLLQRRGERVPETEAAARARG